MLIDLIAFHQIPVHLNATVEEITKDSVIITGKKGKLELEADTVVLSIGYKPNDELFKEVYGATDKKVWLIGDAKNPSNIMNAVKDGSAIGALI